MATLYTVTFIIPVDDDGEEKTLKATCEQLTMASAILSLQLRKLTGKTPTSIEIDGAPFVVPDPTLN